MTERELLVTTVKAYTSENRAVASRTCVYSPTETSKGCAIGRHLKLAHAKEIDVYYIDKDSSISSVIGYFHQYIPDWMKNMKIDFLREIQLLHDNIDNWHRAGITNVGKKIVRDICEKFGLEQLTEEEFKHEKDI